MLSSPRTECHRSRPDGGIMSAIESTPSAVMYRIARAVNDHDVEAFARCLAPDYDSRQPAHPARPFSGSEQARTNWTAMFESIPDLRVDIIALTEQDEAAWTEWHWHGTRVDGTPFDMRGVTIFG